MSDDGLQLAWKLPSAEDALLLPERLDRSDCDAIVAIDLIHDDCESIRNTEGKFFAPVSKGSYAELYRYCAEQMVHPDDRHIYSELMRPETLMERLAKADTPGLLYAQFRYKLLDGNWRWVEQMVVGGAENGMAEGTVRVYVYDIQEEKDGLPPAPLTAAGAGLCDELTGLLPKKQFFAACREKLRDRSIKWCMLAIDIENFKLFNEWFGHESGDLLLAQLGGILRREGERCGGAAGYMGQDDFCLLCPYDMADIRRLYDDLHRLIMSRGTSVGFLPAFGISLPQKRETVAALLDHATLAGSQIKGDYHTRIKLYDPAVSSREEREYRILSDFQRALKNRELYFCLQPQCVVSTGLIVGAESLARWRTPDGELVSPEEFVPVLERYGFVTELDEYIWEDVCAWLHRWMRAGHRIVPISINVSQIDFFSIDVPEYIDRLTQKYELPKSALKIEITESAYVNDAEVIRSAAQRLRDKGFLILMDDFGSGYSSLNMLRQLNVDVIKLDAQFLHLGEADNKKGVHILETVVNMTKTIAIPIIVEGVESPEQANFLEKLGCRYIQGYYYYHPLPVEEFEKLIVEESNVDQQGFQFLSNQQFSVREFMDQNIYSDSMLNNILGAAAFYCWDGKETVDIVRYNEQFRRLANVPDFSERLCNIAQYFHPNDVKPFFKLLARAEKDRLNGSEGVLGVYRTDGSLGRFFEHFYFLEEGENGKIFYGAMQEVTEITTLQNQMRLLSKFSSESIVFLRREGDILRYQVVVHGLRESMGLTKAAFERELNNGAFLARLRGETSGELRELIARDTENGTTGIAFEMDDPAGKKLKLYLKLDYVHDEYSSVEYILAFRRREET